MIKVESYFFPYNPNSVLRHLEIPEKSILWLFSSKFGLLLLRVCIHTCFKFGGLFRKYGGESIVQSQVICFNTTKFH